MTLADLQNLDWQRPGDWPWIVKIGSFVLMFIVIGVASYYFLYSDQIAAFETEERKEKTLKDAWTDKKKLAVNLELYKQQRAEIEQAFGALLKQLPTKSEIDALLIDVNQAGLGRGLKFELFKPAPSENFTEFYAELPVAVQVTGNYHDIGAFTSDVSKLPRIVLLQDLDIKTTVPNGPLKMDAVAKTFRYLDDEEAARQRKVAKDAKDAAGAKK
jgi:type IV pilus assembly protein PilO